ncbi:ATP-binding cassette glutathione S-conjugate transporter YCF1 [Sugiyamaella lignohabitans]|uniref:ATP-binding cassette glutathione S-conjugate transporter YCF1 n=1 Tax=Sugiyamaella lignohabitans TaxID=796027 RepID=A0A161HKJ5_9ASCO|nr:ATP-binding cassette glutathione S-conjugate transporter YCF1 [Sugiyamaella lignohabitans]ANB12248.1 ATP-binding cassette glutathione S-conjugate transporter YCF1 [Sugiyamaella lignohabitans]
MRKKQMQYKDERTRLTTEIFTNVKSLKLYGWEGPLLERLDHVRNGLQLANLKQMILFSCVIDFVWILIPYFISCSTFALYAYLEDVPLTADIVFPCITLFDMMTSPLNDIPRMISMIVDSTVSFVRVRDFLVSQELQTDAIIRQPAAVESGEVSIDIKDASFLWDENDESSTILTNVNFSAHKGSLFCIVGKVGAGKTSFLKALLGDLYRKQGSVTVKGSIAYVAQDPWLVNGTVKDNILFGCRYDPEFYQKTIEACALVSDLEILPDGDNTEIGERGVSLSGGQKARVSLARAVYARADVYLLDDPLSAVDEHVRKHITDNVIAAGGLLASKTIVLATNAISILSKAYDITLLENGAIREQKSFTQVMEERSGLLFELIEEHGTNQEEPVIGSPANSSVTEIVTTGTEPLAAADSETISSIAPLSRKSSVTTLRRASMASYTKKKVKLPKAVAKKTQQTREDTQSGRVKWHVYRRYVDACGYVALAVSGLLILLSSVQTLAANFWLKAWAEQNATLGSNENVKYWIGGYLALGFLSAFISTARRIVARINCGLTASKILHDRMAYTVMRSPMSFFETTPVGRIINRFSSDVNELDEGLPVAFLDLIRTIVKLIVSLGVVIYGAPIVLVIMIPLSGLYYYYQFYYQSASRELKRLLSISRSPIFAHFQESLNGISTIRAFDQGDRFKHLNTQKIDGNIRAIFLFRSANRWLSFRLQSIGAVIVLTTASTIVIGSSRGIFTPGLIGIIMTYTSQVTELLSWIVKAIVNLETSVVGVERVLEYCDLPNEAPEVIENVRPPAYWPTEGKVSYSNYSTRYRTGLDLVLKGVNLDINPREKIGIVGRTGAGKSSLVMSLFRIIEPVDGSINIDGQDITKMGLLDLRSNLSIIPQDSQVFEGTLRQNLDPVGLYSDDELWRVLQLSHLKDHVLSMEGGLDASIAEGGSNLSSGQRQLMCLGRALLHSSSVLVLDEATASVDVQTDKVVQETIRSEFKDKTIITIAHRINTILDSDRIAVLEKGLVAEFDTPENLLKNEESLFYSLCKQGGLLKDDSSSESS